MAGRRYKFPVPSDYKRGVPAILCPADRVIALFNQETGNAAQRIAKGVRDWFAQEAHHCGWSGVHFLPEAMSNHGAGCVMWIRSDFPQPQVTQDTLVLIESTQGED